MITKERLKKKADYLREWRARDPERTKAYHRAYYHANKDKVHSYPSYTREYKRQFTVKQYGLTHEQYLELHRSQNGLCAMCHLAETAVNPSGEIRGLNIDHCHKTGRVRGLLCRNCNVALGLIKDNTELLKHAVTYLETCTIKPPQL
jgi:hypothetical protein